MVIAIICGMITKRRDQVLIGFLSPFCWTCSTFFSKDASMNGPFFKERGMLYPRLSINGDEQCTYQYACSYGSCNPYLEYPMENVAECPYYGPHHHHVGGR